jgi:hypothetical protein
MKSIISLPLIRCFVRFSCGLIAAIQSFEDVTSSEPGLLDRKPSKGRHVQVSDRFMVCYFETIPGAEAPSEMVPVASGVFYSPARKRNVIRILQRAHQ